MFRAWKTLQRKRPDFDFTAITNSLSVVDTYDSKHKPIKMRFKRIIVLGLLFRAGLMYAQTDFRPGYVITVINDTLFGEIDYRGDLLMGEHCRFRLNGNGNEIKYTPVELTAYRFNESKYFISKEVAGKKVFLEFLIKGQINIYYLRDDNGDHYFLEKDSTGIIEVPNEKEILLEKDPSISFKSTRHIGLLSYYMQDAPEFQSRIGKMGKPEHENLIKLVEDYHNLVCKDEACIIYEKKIPLLKLELEVIGGIVNYQDFEGMVNYQFYDYITKKNYFQMGLLANFWMPRVNEKFFLRTGMLYSTLDTNNSSKAILKFPITIEYVYPRGIIRPKMAFGINLYKPFYQSVAFMGGVNIKLHQSVYLVFNYDIDFNPNEKFPLFPVEVFSQSIMTGFLLKFKARGDDTMYK
jgi:hypothetical protein